MRYHPLFLSVLASLLSLYLAQGSICTANTFQITGNGKVSVNPDIIRVNIAASGDGLTAAAALSSLNARVNNLLKTFSLNNIPAANYSTSSININQNYNYSNKPVTVTGSTASQTLALTLGGSNALSGFLQSLTNDFVTINSLVYDLTNQDNALRQARFAAIADAKTKYSQYLTLTSLRDGGLKKIVDLNNEVYTPYQSNLNLYALTAKLSAPPAQVQVSASVDMTWKVQN